MMMFYGFEQYDYQGWIYMYVLQDFDVDLWKEFGSIINYILKKQIYFWKDYSKVVMVLCFFFKLGYLFFLVSVDFIVKIWDVYYQCEFLWIYFGYLKVLLDVCFNVLGMQFLFVLYDCMMKLWDMEMGKCISKFMMGKILYVVKFNLDLEYVYEFLVGMLDKKIVQFDMCVSLKENLVQEYDYYLVVINIIVFVDQNRCFMIILDDKFFCVWDYNIFVLIKYIVELDMYFMICVVVYFSGKYVVY